MVSLLHYNKLTMNRDFDYENNNIGLLDDKGNIINLNGMDWSVTLISENLYQY
jgi:hypothetical protein